MRWNDFTRVYPVQFDHEAAATPREVRLTSPAARPGDPVEVTTPDGWVVIGTIRAIISSVFVVTPDSATAPPRS